MQFINAHGVPYSPDKFLAYNDVLLMPQPSDLTSRNDPKIDLRTRLTSGCGLNVPIISANMDTVTEIEMVKAMASQGAIGILHRFYKDPAKFLADAKEFIRLFDTVGFSVGVSQEHLSVIEAVLNLGPRAAPIVCVDIAHGHLKKCSVMVSAIRRTFGDKVQIIAGNVCTPMGVSDLVKAGADAIKIGVGGGCFTSDTMVLMADGTYRNINKIIPGEKVINMHGEPVRVKSVINQGYKAVDKVRTSNWYQSFYVTPDHRYWIGDLSKIKQLNKVGISKTLSKPFKNDKSKYSWIPIEQSNVKGRFVSEPGFYKFQLPSNFSIDLLDYSSKCYYTDSNLITHGSKTKEAIKTKRLIKSSYSLGYIFGTFLGDGHSNLAVYEKSKRGSCHWTFGLDEYSICEKLVLSIKEVFDIDCTVSSPNGSDTLQVNCYSKILAEMFDLFGKKSEKHLPEKFMCIDKDYLSGLYDGLMDSDGCYDNNRDSFHNTSLHLSNLVVFICKVLGKSYSCSFRKPTIGALKNVNIENCKPSYLSRVHSSNRFSKDYVYAEILDYEKLGIMQEVWDIEVDCPTHSFIANNSIVHNSICSTRIVTGHGSPNLTTIMQARQTISGMQSNATLIADGGITSSGDIIKALAAGADSVMVGGLFAGTDESPGTVDIDSSGKGYKIYRGQSSQEFLDDLGRDDVAPEGVQIEVPYKGSVNKILKDLIGGIRSGLTYSGAKNLQELYDKAIFTENTYHGYVESTPHGATNG